MADDIEVKFVTAKLIKDMIKESQEHPDRQAFIKEMKRCWKYMKANDTSFTPTSNGDDTERDWGKPVGFENRIAKNVYDMLSLMLKNNPIVRHYPQSDKPEFCELADRRDDMLLATWRPDNGNMSSVIRTEQLEAMVSGLCISKIFWDSNNRFSGNGQIAGNKIPHEDLFIDPFALNDQRGLDCGYIIHRTRHSKEYILARYGSEGEIALGLRSPKGRKKGSLAQTASGAWSRFAGYVKEELINPLKNGTSPVDAYDKIEKREYVYEAWIFPTVQSDSNLVSGEDVAEEDHPYGVVATMIRDRIVKIIANPYVAKKPEMVTDEMDVRYGQTKETEIGARRHPFVFHYWLSSVDKDGRNSVYCCQGAVSAMIPAQSSFNDLATNIFINAVTLANPGLVVAEAALSGVPDNRYTHQPSTVYKIAANYRGSIPPISFLQGASLPEYVYLLWQEKGKAITELGGFSDIMNGLRDMGTSHTPAGTVAGLQEASFAPLFSPITALSEAIYDMSTIIEGLMQLYYEEGRFINISQKGRQTYLQWKTLGENSDLFASFTRVVVSGSTTPMEDIGKSQAVMAINQMVSQALLSQNPSIMESTVLTLKNMNRAYTWDWIQLLQKEIAKLTSIEESKQKIGAASILGQLTQGQGNAGQGQQQPQEQGGQPALDLKELEQLANQQ